MDLAERRKKVVEQVKKEIAEHGDVSYVFNEYPYKEDCHLCGKPDADTALEFQEHSDDYPVRLHPFCWMVIKAELDYAYPEPMYDWSNRLPNVAIEGKAYNHTVTVKDGWTYHIEGIRDPALAHLIRGEILHSIYEGFPAIIDKAVRHAFRVWENDNGPWQGRD